jgi:flagellar basal-body rod protein FlgB
MTLDEIPLFAMLKGKLGYLSDRQRLIAQNVANADTPGYAPNDLKPFSIPTALAAAARAAPGMAQAGVRAVRTNATHISTQTPTKTIWKTTTGPDSEITLDGNQVVLEDQMMKMTESRLDHDAAIGLYQKSVAMLRLAARRPSA